MSELQLYLFGEPRLVWQRRTLHPDRRKALALLAFLAMHQAHGYWSQDKLLGGMSIAIPRALGC
jgi:hypothetical protein